MKCDFTQGLENQISKEELNAFSQTKHTHITNLNFYFNFFYHLLILFYSNFYSFSKLF